MVLQGVEMAWALFFEAQDGLSHEFLEGVPMNVGRPPHSFTRSKER